MVDLTPLETSARDGRGRSGVSVMVPPTCTSTFTSSPGLRWANSSKAESKIIPWELPTLLIVLTMRNTMFYGPVAFQAFPPANLRSWGDPITVYLLLLRFCSPEGHELPYPTAESGSGVRFIEKLEPPGLSARKNGNLKSDRPARIKVKPIQGWGVEQEGGLVQWWLPFGVKPAEGIKADRHIFHVGNRKQSRDGSRAIPILHNGPLRTVGDEDRRGWADRAVGVALKHGSLDSLVS